MVRATSRGAGQPQSPDALSRLALRRLRSAFGSKERSRTMPQAPLAAKEGKEAPRRQSGTARLEDIVTRRTRE